MTANELADELGECSCVYYDSTTNQYFDDIELSKKIATMLREQAQEIADLKISNQDLKYQLIQKAGEQVLNDFKELIDENDDIFRKEQVEKFYAEARPLREKYKPRELTDDEIIDAWKMFPNWGHEQHILMFGRELLKKASEK